MGTKRKAEKRSEVSNPRPAGGLFGSKADFDPALNSLFSSSLGPVSKPRVVVSSNTRIVRHDDDAQEEDDEELSSIDSELDSNPAEERADDDVNMEDVKQTARIAMDGSPLDEPPSKKRKRKQHDDDLEDQYMAKLARSEAKDARKTQNRWHELKEDATRAPEEEDQDEAENGSDLEDDATASPPPRHETVSGDQPDLEKAARTVFLANVSTEAITSKSARKTLLAHLSSHLEALGTNKPLHKVESLRFRSTAFASALPKRAAFTKKELMDATTKATNAYAVYSTKEAARDAARKLNGTVVLNRHLRVDEVAHPAKTDHRRCVFVGNLGFVDDESIMEANTAEEGGKKKSKKQKEPADIEEGLWREFSKAGTVESVRVIRDAKTRVGKGIAYVQFTDENGVEAALLFNDKKFPPLLPRKLRVTRARAVKRNAAKKTGGASSLARANGVYAPKVSSQQQSLQGRAGRLLGKAGAAQMQGKSRSGDRPGPRSKLGAGIKPPETFVFEGHRATSGQKPKFKMKKGKPGKPQSRSSKRAAAWKASGGKK